MEDKEPIGSLFNSIVYYKQEDLDSLVDNMTIEQSIYFLNQALRYAHSANIYSMEEIEILSKTLRNINKNILVSPENE